MLGCPGRRMLGNYAGSLAGAFIEGKRWMGHRTSEGRASEPFGAGSGTGQKGRDAALTQTAALRLRGTQQ
jgi:hypothetical protein